MAWDNSKQTITLKSHADYSAKQYRFVKINSAGSAELSGADEDAVGVLQNTPAAGEAAVVAIGGVSKLYIGTTGSLVAGSQVAAMANGEGILANSGAFNLGYALEDSTADGDIISIIFTGGNGVKTA